MQAHLEAPARPGTGSRDMPDAMTALLRRSRPQTDSEALAVLRRAFPAAPLCERVAAVSRWRAG